MACHGVGCLALAALVALAARARGHSWVACTDYRGSPNFFEQDKCFGWPRDWDNRHGSTAPAANGYQIAADTGRDHQPGGACDIPMSSPDFAAAYSASFPHAVYEQGQVYCLAWPMKNHGAASCTNPYVPDSSLTLMVSSVDPSSDPTQAEFNTRNINELAGFANNCNPDAAGSSEKTDECQLGLEKHQYGQQDCKGFQRSPRFCDSTGNSMGTGCFKVPANMEAGHYVAQWFWEFNPGSFYTSCFDFTVRPAGAEEATPGPTGTVGQADTEYLPCSNNMLKLTGQAPAPVVPSPSSPAPSAPVPVPGGTGGVFSPPVPSVPTTATGGPDEVSAPGPADTCPVAGFGLPLSTYDCYCGFVGEGGEGCESDDGSACWCKCCCHYSASHFSCRYQMPESNAASATARAASAVLLAAAFSFKWY